MVLTSLVSAQEQTGLFAPRSASTSSWRRSRGSWSPRRSRCSRARPATTTSALRYATGGSSRGPRRSGARRWSPRAGRAPIMAVVADRRVRGAVPVLRIQGTALAMTFVIAAGLHAARDAPAQADDPLQRDRAGRQRGHGPGAASSHGAEGAAFGTLLGEASLACAYAWGIVGGDPLMRPRFLRVGRMVVADRPRPAGVVPAGPGRGRDARRARGLRCRAAGPGALPTEIREHLPGPLARLGPTLHDSDTARRCPASLSSAATRPPVGPASVGGAAGPFRRRLPAVGGQRLGGRGGGAGAMSVRTRRDRLPKGRR